MLVVLDVRSMHAKAYSFTDSSCQSAGRQAVSEWLRFQFLSAAAWHAVALDAGLVTAMISLLHSDSNTLTNEQGKVKLDLAALGCLALLRPQELLDGTAHLYMKRAVAASSVLCRAQQTLC